jgi:hypothetical protein
MRLQQRVRPALAHRRESAGIDDVGIRGRRTPVHPLQDLALVIRDEDPCLDAQRRGEGFYFLL